MKFIDKQNIPRAFQNWLTDENDVLQKMYQDDRITGDVVWKHLDNKREVYDKKRLKETLVNEQGFLCCYCGRRIFPDHNSHIEHFFPKNQYKHCTYDYDNLFISCQGGTKDEIHLIKEGETLESVATKFGLEIDFLEEIYVDNKNLEVFNKVSDFEETKVGDRILIYRKVSNDEHHCGHRKGKAELDIIPSDRDCEEQFSYRKRTGEIKITEKNTRAVKTLGLNDNKYLTHNRLKQIEQAVIRLNRIFKIFGKEDKELLREKRNILLQQLERKNEDGHLKPWNFVQLSILKGR